MKSLKINMLPKLLIAVSCLASSAQGAPLSSIGESAMGQDKGNPAQLGSEAVGAVSWFSGTEPVHYCVDSASDFPVAREILILKTGEAINQWVALLSHSDHRYYAEIGPLKYLDLNFSLVPTCDGSEDIHFYFGKASPEVEAAIKNFANPILAIAQQTAVDKSKAWSKGFVWLAAQGSIQTNIDFQKLSLPDWHKDYQLYALLLHEIGHIFGSNHMSGTIMRQDIAYSLAFVGLDGAPWNNLGTDYFYHINQQRMILPPVEDDYDFPGQLGFTSEPSAQNTTSPESVFRLLTGIVPVGKIQARLRYSDGYDNPASAQLDITDGQLNHFAFPITLDNMGGESRIIDNSQQGVGGMHIGVVESDSKFYPVDVDNDVGAVTTGHLRTKSGQDLEILIQVNMYSSEQVSESNGPVRIGYLDEAQHVWKSLFQSSLIYSPF